jgi:hypothetical protein
MPAQRLVELGYSEKYGLLELTVPYGTKAVDLGKISEKIFADFLRRLPRACPACISGQSLLIRERLENVLQVDLDKGRLVEKT